MSHNPTLCTERLEAVKPLYIALIMREESLRDDFNFYQESAVRPISYLCAESKGKKWWPGSKAGWFISLHLGCMLIDGYEVMGIALCFRDMTGRTSWNGEKN